MFDDWKKRRSLRRQLGQIDKYYAPLYKAAKTADDHYNVFLQYEAENAEEISLLRWLETKKVKNTAARLGVEIPEGFIGGHSEENKYTGRTYLNDEGLTYYRRHIARARFAYWKQWAELLVPILSLLVAIIALLFAKSGGTPCPPCPPPTH
jgi:hypothetical protein